jgi:hypothetical protein
MAPNSDGAPVATQTADVPSPTSYCGSSHGSQNHKGNRCNVNRGHANTTSIMGRARFESREPSMKGHIHDFTGERNLEQWINTTKEIFSFVGCTYTKFTPEFTKAVKELRLADPVEHTNPNLTNPIAFELWKLEIREY